MLLFTFHKSIKNIYYILLLLNHNYLDLDFVIKYIIKDPVATDANPTYPDILNILL